MSRCKPVYRVSCKVFDRRSGKMYLPNRLRLQGHELGKMCICPCFSALCLRKKTSKNCFFKVFYYAAWVSRFRYLCDRRLCTGTKGVTVQARLSCFLQSFLSSFRKDVFTEPSTAARSEMRKNVHFPVFFSSISTKKDPEELLLQGLLLCGSG